MSDLSISTNSDDDDNNDNDVDNYDGDLVALPTSLRSVGERLPVVPTSVGGIEEVSSIGTNESNTDDNHDDGDFESTVLSNTNHMLSMVGIKPKLKEITSLDELTRVASSVFVATYESLFHVKIDGVIRHPTTINDYAENAQLVIGSVAERIDMELQHISGYDIVRGDLTAISNLVNIFIRIASITGYPPPNSELFLPSSGASQDTDITSRSKGDEIHYQENTATQGPQTPSTKSPQSTHKSPSPPHTPTSKVNSGGLFQLSIARQMHSNAAFMKQSEKLLAAQQRRQQHLSSKSNKCKAGNNAKLNRAENAKFRRHIEDKAQQVYAHKVRQSSVEEVGMHKLYKNVKSKMRAWSLEETQAVRDCVSHLKRETLDDLSALQTTFDHQLAMLDEEVPAATRALSRERRCLWHPPQKRNPLSAFTNKTRQNKQAVHDIICSRQLDVLKTYNRNLESVTHSPSQLTPKNLRAMARELAFSTWEESLRASSSPF